MTETRYAISAFNTAFESENRIHDDGVAQKFGFEGGLVPGVDDYAYMTRAALILLGPDFLTRGHMTCRFDRPVYDGETVDVIGETAADGGVDIRIEARGSTAATGTARLTEEAALPTPDVAGFPTGPMPSHEERPKAGPESLPAGRTMGTLRETIDAATHAQYLKDVREEHPLYAEAGLVHPGFLLRRANTILRDTVRLGPWIHVGSAIQHLGTLSVGSRLETRAVVSRLYDHKGHGFVELDVLLIGEGSKPVASIHHTAIYEPRQIRAA